MLFEQPRHAVHGRESRSASGIAIRNPLKTKSSDGKSLSEFEDAARRRKLEASGEPVTATSSIRHIFGEIGDKPDQEDNDVDMVANLRSEVVCASII